MEQTQEKLGSTTNLLYGYDAAWLSKSKGNEALFPVPGNSLKKVDAQLPETIGAWSLPFVSLHDTAESLLDVLFPYEVKNPSDGTGMMIRPSGNGKMTMDYSKKNTFYFNEKSKTCGMFGCNSPRTSRQSTDITLNIYTSLPTEITGSGGEDQHV